MGGVAWLHLAAFHLWHAREAALDGLDQVEAAREELSPDDLLDGSAEAYLDRARGRFEAADRHLHRLSVAPLRLLPVVGRQVRSAGDLADAAHRVTVVGSDAVAEATGLFEDPPPAGPDRVAFLRDLGGLASSTDAELEGLDLGPTRAIVGPLVRARNRLELEVADLREALGDASAAAGGLADLLEGPRRYLVLAANNAEMRAGSGMFLSAGVMETGGGRLDLGEMGRTPDIPAPAEPVPLTGDLADRWGWLEPNIEWRNLAATPRFDATAELAADMWEASGGGPVDGVLAVDAVALRALLAATGPVEVEGDRLGEDDVLEYVLHGQYAALSDEWDERHDEQIERREKIGALARAAVDALDERDWEAAELVEGLADAVTGRHVMAWSRRSPDAEAFEAGGVEGRLEPDSLLLSLMNTAGKKLDWFVKVDARLDLAAEDDATAATLRVEVRNTTPADEPAYILGPNRRTTGLGPGDYRALLAVNLPASARGGRIDGADLIAAGADGPTRVVATQIEVPRGKRRTFVVRFELPADGSLTVEPTARVPGVRWRTPARTWRDERPHQVAWGDRR